MRVEHFYFRSAEGSRKIHGMCWLPEGEVRAVVQLVHGMSEYIARYDEFARYLTEQGMAVAGHDHLGHGDSAAGKEDYGYFAKEHGSRALVRDIHQVYRRMKKKYDNVPYFIFGHSMGSFLTRLYLCRYGDGLDGAVLCGTGYHSEAETRMGMALCGLGGEILGWKHHSGLFQWLTSGVYNLQFRPNRTSVDWISRNRENVDAYLADEKCGFSFTFNGYYNLMLTLNKISRPEYLACMPRSLPVLFISGAEDPVGDSGKGVRQVEKQFRELGMQDVTCILYPEDRHEILNEPDREKVYGDVVRWMRERQRI
ncbi:MAG: alpha/beta hydrolase [Clostridiales bacterium]|nr:alpha/beta hydrolase [Clostridiales bacterium]